MPRQYDDTVMRLAREWVRVGFYLPMTWREYLALDSVERYAIISSLKDLLRERDGQGPTGLPRQDRRLA